MKFTIAAVVLALSSFAAADYSVSDLPACSITCLTQAIASTSCSASDIHCQCTTGLTAITTSAGPCLLKACSADDATKAATVSQGLCKQDASGSSSSVKSSTSASGTATAGSASAAATSNAATSNMGGIFGAGAGLVAAGLLAL